MPLRTESRQPPPKPWPKLSETLGGPREPGTCQACGLSADLFGVGDLERWQEAGEFDEPGAVIVLLCEPCARRLIVPHPRLYRCLALFKPYPGAEKFCLDCRHRRELECGHPDLMRNGGKGLALTGPSPLLACVRPGGLKTIYPGPPTSCAGHDPATT